MEITIQNKKENAIKWIEALLSGNYRQAKNILGNEENGFCCWGLGCYIVNLDYDPCEGWDIRLGNYIGFLDKNGGISPEVIEKPHNFSTLDQLNDLATYSFEQIAKYLIKNAKTNFEPEVAEAIQNHFSEHTTNSES